MISQDLVAKQYEEFVYPLPIQDLEDDVATGHYEMLDPFFFRRKYWPKNVEPENLNILIAGCGTSQAARIAYRNKNCRVVGIDISKSSLGHQLYLKNKHFLNNLEVHQLEIENVKELQEKFDLIISTGVLHHLRSPTVGLSALKEVLLPHGVMGIMLYGKYPRVGVYMLQEVFKTLKYEQTPTSIEKIKTTLRCLPQWHYLRRYLEMAEDLHYDSGIVDTFLHTRDVSYSVDDIYQFADSAGMQLQDWFDKLDISLDSLIPKGHPLYMEISQLPQREQWRVAELLSQDQARQMFILTHIERDKNEFQIDFKNKRQWLKYKPSIRYPMKVIKGCKSQNDSPAVLNRWKNFELTYEESRMFELCNGKKTIEDIVKTVYKSNNSDAKIVENCRIFFENLSNTDHLLMEI